MEKGSKMQKNKWVHKEVMSLLKLWAEHVEDIRTKLSKKNFKVYRLISLKLKEQHDINKLPQEISSKVVTMTSRYKRDKSIFGSASTWMYYEHVDAILKNEPLSNLNKWSMDSNESTNTNSSRDSIDSIPVGMENQSVDVAFEDISLPSIMETPLKAADEKDESPIEIEDIPVNNIATNRKIKNAQAFEHKLLQEIKRANQASEKEMHIANEIAKASLSIQKEMLAFFTSMQK